MLPAPLSREVCKGELLEESGKVCVEGKLAPSFLPGLLLSYRDPQAPAAALGAFISLVRIFM